MGPTLSSAPGQLRPAALVRGRGWLQLVYPPAPAAGANLVHTVPGECWERLLSVAFTLSTSATVAARGISMNFTDGDGNIWNSSPIAQQIPASTTLSGYGDTHGGDTLLPGVDLSNEGSQTTPLALTTIATLTGIPAGEYTATVYLTIGGTPAQGADGNNVQLDNGGALVYEHLDNSIAPGVQVFGPFDLELGAASTVSVRNIGAATAGAIYSATLVLVDKFQSYTWEFPDFVLKSAWSVQLVISGVQAGDQLSKVILYTERYPTTYLATDRTDPVERLAELLLQSAGG